ncbi:MAG: conjugative transfer protein MobI(A/C), partial [Blautia producta]|nr:conjugative transfer protein MobI(A/C) [Blautia producta]
IEIQEECMKDLLIKLYEAHRAQNIRSIDSVAAEAKNEIDNYWTIWKTRNKEIISTSNVQKQDSEKLGRYAPRLGHIGSAKKLTINWDDYASRLKGVPAMHRAIRVKPLKAGMYSINCFPKCTEWEWRLIFEYESKFCLYRESLEYFHKYNIELSRKIRKLKNIKSEDV